MEKMYMKEGRFVPPPGPVTEAERLRAVESFLMRFSEEMECFLNRWNESVLGTDRDAFTDEEVAS